MQLEDAFIQFPVCCRETMVQAKVVRPGWRAECLCPMRRFLKVALEGPVSSSSPALYPPPVVHVVKESLYIFLWYQIFGLDDDGATSRLILANYRADRFRFQKPRFIEGVSKVGQRIHASSLEGPRIPVCIASKTERATKSRPQRQSTRLALSNCRLDRERDPTASFGSGCAVSHPGAACIAFRAVFRPGRWPYTYPTGIGSRRD